MRFGSAWPISSSASAKSLTEARCRLGRVLGVDVGIVRVGIALSDPTAMIAQPLEVIDRRKLDPARRVAELVRAQDVERIVVGRPLRLDGVAGDAVKAVERFVLRLAKFVTIPIDYWDERLTTAQAQREMIDAGVRRGDRRCRVDKIAAALILQTYLDARGK
jgi:putative Holliday junction resolvase